MFSVGTIAGLLSERDVCKEMSVIYSREMSVLKRCLYTRDLYIKQMSVFWAVPF